MAFVIVTTIGAVWFFYRVRNTARDQIVFNHPIKSDKE